MRYATIGVFINISLSMYFFSLNFKKHGVILFLCAAFFIGTLVLAPSLFAGPEDVVPDSNFRKCINKALGTGGDTTHPISQTEMKRLQRLDCSNSTITSIEGIQYATNLTVLNVSYNQITFLPEKLFAGLTNLTELSLSYNQITSLPEKLFAGLTNLTELSLSSNQITSLPEKLFAGLTNLTKLHFYDNQITSLPEKLFAGLTSLTKLDFSENQITGPLPEKLFAGLTSLTWLDFSENQITGPLPEKLFAGLMSLTELDFSENQITGPLPEKLFAGLTSLTVLDFSENQITGPLPEKLFAGLTSLTWLDFSLNKITSLPEKLFAGLTSLTKLSFSFNKITSLPEKLFAGLTSLTKLSFSFNKITSLPEKLFAGLTSLTELDFSYNQITSLPEKLFAGLTSLTELDFSKNQITGPLPEKLFAGLTSLTWLDFFANQITSLPEKLFAGLTSLKELSFSNNQITGPLPEKLFAGLTSLTWLDFSLNKITSLPEKLFAGLTSLTELDFSRNQITGPLPEKLFAGLTSLTELDFSRNQITGPLPEKLFAGLTSLTSLHFSRNQISSIPPKAPEALKSNDSSGENQSVTIVPTTAIIEVPVHMGTEAVSLELTSEGKRKGFQLSGDKKNIIIPAGLQKGIYAHIATWNTLWISVSGESLPFSGSITLDVQVSAVPTPLTDLKVTPNPDGTTAIVSGKTDPNTVVIIDGKTTLSDFDGEFSLLVDLENTSREITITAKAKDKTPTSGNVTLPPKQASLFLDITVTNDSNGKTVTISGKTDPGASVTLDGKIAIVNAQGNFSMQFDRKEKSYTVYVTASAPGKQSMSKPAFIPSLEDSTVPHVPTPVLPAAGWYGMYFLNKQIQGITFCDEDTEPDGISGYIPSSVPTANTTRSPYEPGNFTYKGDKEASIGGFFIKQARVNSLTPSNNLYINGDDLNVYCMRWDGTNPWTKKIEYINGWTNKRDIKIEIEAEDYGGSFVPVNIDLQDDAQLEIMQEGFIIAAKGNMNITHPFTATSFSKGSWKGGRSVMRIPKKIRTFETKNTSKCILSVKTKKPKIFGGWYTVCLEYEKIQVEIAPKTEMILPPKNLGIPYIEIYESSSTNGPNFPANTWSAYKKIDSFHSISLNTPSTKKLTATYILHQKPKTNGTAYRYAYRVIDGGRNPSALMVAKYKYKLDTSEPIVPDIKDMNPQHLRAKTNHSFHFDYINTDNGAPVKLFYEFEKNDIPHTFDMNSITPDHLYGIDIVRDISKVDIPDFDSNKGTRNIQMRITKIEDAAGNIIEAPHGNLPKIFSWEVHANQYSKVKNFFDPTSSIFDSSSNIADGTPKTLLHVITDEWGNLIVPISSIGRTVTYSLRDIINTMYLNQHTRTGPTSVYVGNISQALYQNNSTDPDTSQASQYPFGNNTHPNVLKGKYPLEFFVYTPTANAYSGGLQGPISDPNAKFEFTSVLSIQDDLSKIPLINEEQGQSNPFEITKRFTNPPFLPLYTSQINGDIRIGGFIEGAIQGSNITINKHPDGILGSLTQPKLQIVYQGTDAPFFSFLASLDSNLLLTPTPTSDSPDSDIPTPPTNPNIVQAGIVPKTLFHHLDTFGPHSFFSLLLQKGDDSVTDKSRLQLSTHFSYTKDGKDVLYNGDIFGKEYYHANEENSGGIQAGLYIIGPISSNQISNILIGQLYKEDITTGFGIYGNVSIALARNMVAKNIALATRNIPQKSVGDILTSLITPSDGNESKGGSIHHTDNASLLMINNTHGDMIILKSAENDGLFEVSGRRTLVIKGANLYIQSNMYYDPLKRDSTLGVVVQKDKDGNGGNLYIAPDVTNIVGSYVLDGSIMTYNDTNSSDSQDGGITNIDILKNQLYIYGSIVSENTIGGARRDHLICPAFVPKNTCDIATAQKYDLNYLRRYYLYEGVPFGEAKVIGGGTCTVDGCTGFQPKLIQKFSVLSENLAKYPVIIEHDPNMLFAPPIGFENFQ